MKKVFLFIFLALSIPSIAQKIAFDSVNSPADELNPVLTNDGRGLYFIRVFDSQNTGGMRDPGDVWYSEYTDSAGWVTPVHLASPVNNPQFNGVIGFSPDGNTMYLYEHYMPGGQPARTQGISTSRKNGDKWSEPLRVDIKYFFNRSDHVSISLSTDGNIMLLSLDSYGTIGAEDIYVSFKKNNEWSEPRNLGRTINTSFQEMTPYLSPDNRTLFFSSNGHGGFGGRDIFVSVRQDDTWRNWSAPQNLGPEVNTEGVELYFQYFPGEEKAIYTSTQNSDGYSDLKVIDFPKSEMEKIAGDSISTVEPAVSIVQNENPITENETETASPDLKITGVVTEAIDGKEIPADIFVKGDNWEHQYHSEPQTGYEIVLPAQDIYQITVEAPGYVSFQEKIDIRTTETFTIDHDFVLQPIAIGTTVKLSNVLFVRGSTELLESSYDELDLVVKMMNENPDMEISLAGHTDNQGNARLNRILSQQRVDAVIYYLTNHGIDKSRLSGRGYGGSQPIASNEAEETRRLNRRVEFTIEKY